MHSPFAAIANGTRREILRLLRDGEKSAGELQRPFSASQSAISQHLAVLRRARLVKQRRDGRQQYYSIEPAKLYEIVSWARHFDQFWDDKLGALGRYLEKKR